MSRIAPHVGLQTLEKEQLETTTRAFSASRSAVLRARIVLLAARQFPNDEIAGELETSRQTVSKWRKRFARHGMVGLSDVARSGRKKTVTIEPIKNAIFALLHSPPSQHNINRTTWRLADIRQCLLQQGI